MKGLEELKINRILSIFITVAILLTVFQVVAFANDSVLLNTVENLRFTTAYNGSFSTTDNVTTLTTASNKSHAKISINLDTGTSSSAQYDLSFHDGTDLNAARYAVISVDVEMLADLNRNLQIADTNVKFGHTKGTFKIIVIADAVTKKLNLYYINGATVTTKTKTLDDTKLASFIIAFDNAKTDLGADVDVAKFSNTKLEVYSGYANLAGLQKAVESQIDYVPSNAEYDSVNKTYSIYVENIKYTAGTDVAYVAGYDASNKLIFAKEVTGGETYTIPSETVADSIKLFIWTKAELKPLFLTGAISQ